MHTERAPNIVVFEHFAHAFRQLVAFRLSLLMCGRKVQSSTTQHELNQTPHQPKEPNMKTEFISTTSKDNVATSTLLTASFIALAIGLFSSNGAEAKPAPVVVQKMNTIVVTASRQVSRIDAKLPTMIVTASRKSATV
jgi:hypothetical protein